MHIAGLFCVRLANSAVSGSNLIPVLSLGISGNAAAVFLILAMDSIGGFNPGPTVFRAPSEGFNAEMIIAFGIFTAMAFANILNWIIGGRINRFLGVPFALMAFVLVVVFGIPFPDGWQDRLTDAIIPQPLLIMPSFSLEALLGIGLPLFVVTMASQNIPGLAVLRANAYDTKSGPLLTTTGIFSVLGAPFGSHAVNLAAITAAMMSGEEAGEDRDKRYTASVICGLAYIILGLFAGVTTAFVSLAPGVLIAAVAGLALFASFSASALAAFTDERERPAAAVTFLASASGMSLFGISGAFWGLIAGGVMLSLVTSLNAIFAWCTRGLFMATQDGWLPQRLAATNRFGTPWIYLSLFFIVGIVPILTGMSLDYVTILGNAVGAIFGLFPVFALFNLIKRNPEAYAAAPFKLPIWATKLLPLLAVGIYAYGIYSSWGFIGNTGWISLAVYAALLLTYAHLRGRHIKANLTIKSV